MPQRFRCPHGRMVIDWRDCPECLMEDSIYRQEAMAKSKLDETKKQTELLRKLLEEERSRADKAEKELQEKSAEKELQEKLAVKHQKKISQKYCSTCKIWINEPSSSFADLSLYLKNICPRCYRRFIS